METAPESAPALHRLLGRVMMVMTAVLLALTYGGIAPLMPADSFSQVIAYTFAAIAVAMVAVALFVLKPRAPRLGPGQSVEEYWSTPACAGKVVTVWLVLEGASTIAAVAFLMTGDRVGAITMALAIVAYWWCGPSVFAKA